MDISMRKVMLLSLLLLSTQALAAEDALESSFTREGRAAYQEYSANPYMMDIQQYFMTAAIGTLPIVFETAPFNTEERQAIASHTALLKNLEENQTQLATIYFETVASMPRGLSTQVKNLTLQFLISEESRELKEELQEIFNASLTQFLASKDTETPRDSHMAARITLIMTIEAFRDLIQTNDEKKTEQWNALLSSFQEECHSSSSSLINDLLQRMGPSFFQKPYTVLLWDKGLQDDVFDALNQIRKDQIKQAGFVLGSNDGILKKFWSYFN